MKQQRIVEAAKSTLLREGLAGWTVERVAREAGCAKGLVHYHFHSKWELLALVASNLRRERIERRAEAFRRQGTAGLDALWAVLLAEVESGECAAWLGLVTLADPLVRDALPPTGDDLRKLAAQVSASLDVSGPSLEAMRVVVASLDGMQIPLLLGDSPTVVREMYDRFWLAVLS